MKRILFSLFVLFSAVIVSAQKEIQRFNDQLVVACTTVKNQQKTGTCWSFATTSFIESEFLRNGKGEFDLSEMFFVRNAYLQKARKFLFYQGKANFSEGGQAHDVMNVIREFGISTDSAFPGNPNTPGLYDHNRLVENLTKTITRINDNFNKNTADEWEKKYTQLLDQHFGPVPETFQDDTRNYTPKSFAKQLDIRPDDYIELTSFSHHPFYSFIDLEVPDNWSHDRYLNLPIDEFITVIDSALAKGFSVCWDGDTSEKGFSHRTGTAELLKEQVTDQNARQQTFLNRSTTDDHLMHLVGTATSDSGDKYYKVKNSWGTSDSNYGGFMYLSLPYIRLKTIAIMVHKSAIPLSVWTKINIEKSAQ